MKIALVQCHEKLTTPLGLTGQVFGNDHHHGATVSRIKHIESEEDLYPGTLTAELHYQYTSNLVMNVTIKWTNLF